MTARRISDFGISIGTLPRGPRNALTDVPGVAVGHCTVRTQAWNTGVTVILPAQDNLFLHKVVGACQVLNGFGKTLGLMQVEELGVIETPIAITNTKGKGAVLVGEDEWAAIEETLYLMGIPGMAESLVKGRDAPVEDCVDESALEW